MTLHTDLESHPHIGPPAPDTTEHDVTRSPGGRVGVVVRAVTADKRLAWGVALLAAVAYGLLAGWWTPRGPMSTFDGLTAMGLGLAIGLLAGVLLRTRWAMLVAPLTFAVAFELARLRVSGPTVDGIHLGSTYGIIAFAVGRGVHGLLALLPMLVGASLGAALARRALSSGRPRRGFLSGVGLWARRGVAVTSALALVALAAFVARPPPPTRSSMRTARRSPAVLPS